MGERRMEKYSEVKVAYAHTASASGNVLAARLAHWQESYEAADRYLVADLPSPRLPAALVDVDRASCF
jgi:hypothetical protein